MKQNYRFKLSCHYLRQHKFRNIILVVLICICFLLVGMAILYNAEVRYCETSAEKFLQKGIVGTGIITMDIENGSDDEKMGAFFEELYHQKYVSGIGNWSYGATASSWGKELAKIQGNHKYSLDNENQNNVSMLEIIGTNILAFEMFDMVLAEGAYPQDLDRKENEYYIYLGAEYSEIEVGTVYQNQIGETAVSYKVAGVFEEGQKILIPQIENVTEFTKTSVYPADYAVVLVSEKGLFDNTILFSCDETNQKEFEKKISELSQKYDFQCEVTMLSKVFDEIAYANQERMDMLVRIAIIIMVLTIILINSQHIVNYMDRRREYGVFYAIGITNVDLIVVLIYETLVVYVGAFIVAAVVIWFGEKFSFFSQKIDEVTYIVERSIILETVYPVFVVLLGINMLISILAVLSIVYKKMPAELLRKDM